MNEPYTASAGMMLTGDCGNGGKQNDEILLVADQGSLSRLTDDRVRAEIAPVMEACGNPFGEDIEEAVLETRRMLQENWKQIIDEEELSDVISQALMSIGCYGEASCHVAWRTENKHAKNAEMQAYLTQMDEIVSGSAEDVAIKRENANINGETPMGVMLRLGSETAKKLYLSRHISERFARAHAKGDIHIHDLDFYTQTTTCTQIDLLKLFHDGFSTGHGMLREPQTIISYAALACIAIQSNQNNQHGGQSVPNFDYAMAEGVDKSFRKNFIRQYVSAVRLLTDEKFTAADAEARIAEAEKTCGFVLRYRTPLPDDFRKALMQGALSRGVKAAHFHEQMIDDILKLAEEDTQRETYQAMEALIHNLNTMHSRAGAQVPFSSLNYGTNTSEEGRLVIRSLLLATQAGLGNGETPIFPVQIFKVKEGVNYHKDDPNYDLFRLAIQTSAQRLFPNFAFLDAPFNVQYYEKDKPETEAAYMGCRTRVMANTYDPEREITYGRGNLSFTSINLPRLAIQAGGSIDCFYRLLDNQLHLVRDQLLERLKQQSARKARCFPFLMGQHVWLDANRLKPDEEVGDVLKHGTLSIGFIGLAETLTALTGAHHGESEAAQKLGLEIIRHMRSFTDSCSQEHRLNFSLLATPAEGLSGRFVRMDREKYGVLPGITDRAYYTNSFHVPVHYPISAYRKIYLEAPYHELTNGGHITYIEMDGDPLKNLSAFESIIRCMHDAGVGYGSINHPVDRDPACGYTGIIDDVCPKCGRTEDSVGSFERIRRITGYLVGTLDHWNDAKRAEEKARVKHFAESM